MAIMQGMENVVAVDAAVKYAAQNGPRFVEELKELLRIPSISTAPAHRGDVRRAAEFVAEGLRSAGLEEVKLIETSTKARSGHPLVYAEWMGAGAEKPTVLLYGHYDVQPAEPLDEWKSPPFEPEERNGNLYARGAVDDKGQMWMHVKALESLMQGGRAEGAALGLPVNVRVLVEGEEEVGGEGIAAFVRAHGEQLRADCALVSDTEMFAPELPTLCVGLRGMIYTEIEVRGARTDLHSGMYGGAAPNPFVALAQMIAQLKRTDGRIAIPKFYDEIEEPTKTELEAWRSLPFEEEKFREEEVGSPELTGERMFSVLERLWSRPTMDVHGMPGGFTGAGAKTVIPAKAVAKISFRLVPGMKPETTFARYKDFVEEICPAGVSVEVRLIHSGEPIVVSTDNRFVRAATEAMAEVFGKETVFVRGGGSIPVVGDFVRELGMPTVLMGFGLPDDNLHAPNEKFNLSNFHRGIESVVRFLGKVGEPQGVTPS
ncbi:MAG TPA: dipeptidase [Acidobacteriaceae bacterium]|nr:dipeptidase [Acidobacteriaceae bacterium]